ncbi:MAG: acetyl-CoA hydrolase/transferase C-terminal domain-containing protein [Oceanicaulis sp.]
MTAPASLSPGALVERFRGRLGETARVYVPGVAAEPYVLAEAFAERAELAGGLEFFGVWIPGVNRTDWSGLGQTSRAETVFLAPELRAGFEAGRVRFLPLSYTQAWRRLETCEVDAAIVQVSPPDRFGLCSLSLASDFTPAVWPRARLRVAQINPALPPMPGAPTIPLDAFDAVTEIETEPRGYDAGSLPPAFEAIAGHVAGLIPDGAAVQFGLGKVQLAVLPALKDHRRLTVHSGMVSEPLLDILDGDQVAAIRTGAVLGSRALAERLRHDPRLIMTPVDRTHSAGVLAGLAHFCAVNSAVEVDLFGQVNAEFVGGRLVSGGGGLIDFARGAQASPGGLSIIALAASAKGGTLSRIVPKLEDGPAALSRADVDMVVTEHGAADLRGLDLDARAEALIGVAAPEFRDTLAHSWTDLRRRL